MSDIFQYQCESCMVVGELDAYYDTFDCPQCGGTMKPLNTVDQPAPYELDEDATIAIPRDFATSEAPPVGVKVAQAVDLGFGGILSKGTAAHAPPGGARVAAPVSTGLPIGVVPAPVPAPAPVPVQTPPAPAPMPAASPLVPSPPLTPTQLTPAPIAPSPPSRVKKKSSGAPKKTFSLGKKPVAASQTATPAGTPATRVPKGKKSFGLKKKSSSRAAAAQTSQQPAAAPAPVPQQPVAKKTRPPGFKIQKKSAKKTPKKATSTAQQPVKTDTGPLRVQSVDAARTQSAFPNIQPHQHNPHAPAELESAAIDQAAKFAALQAELEAERAARLEAEQRVANEQVQLAEQTRLEEEERRRQEEERAQLLAQQAAEQAKIEAQQQAMAQIEAERKEIEYQAEELRREREELAAKHKELASPEITPADSDSKPEQEEKKTEKDDPKKKQRQKPGKINGKTKPDSDAPVRKKKGPRPPGSKPKPGQKKAGMAKTGMKRKPGMTKTGMKPPGKPKRTIQKQKTKEELLEEMKTENPEMYREYVNKKKKILIIIAGVTVAFTIILCLITYYIRTH